MSISEASTSTASQSLMTARDLGVPVELMTWQQVARSLGVKSRFHVDQARKAGLLPACAVGRSYRYHPADVAELQDRLRRGEVVLAAPSTKPASVR